MPAITVNVISGSSFFTPAISANNGSFLVEAKCFGVHKIKVFLATSNAFSQKHFYFMNYSQYLL